MEREMIVKFEEYLNKKKIIIVKNTSRNAKKSGQNRKKDSIEYDIISNG